MLCVNEFLGLPAIATGSDAMHASEDGMENNRQNADSSGLARAPALQAPSSFPYHAATLLHPLRVHQAVSGIRIKAWPQKAQKETRTSHKGEGERNEKSYSEAENPWQNNARQQRSPRLPSGSTIRSQNDSAANDSAVLPLSSALRLPRSALSVRPPPASSQSQVACSPATPRQPCGVPAPSAISRSRSNP